MDTWKSCRDELTDKILGVDTAGLVSVQCFSLVSRDSLGLEYKVCIIIELLIH